MSDSKQEIIDGSGATAVSEQHKQGPSFGHWVREHLGSYFADSDEGRLYARSDDMSFKITTRHYYLRVFPLEGESYFQDLAAATIGKDSIKFTKYGRPRAWEQHARPESEELRVIKDGESFRIIYELQNIGGEASTFEHDLMRDKGNHLEADYVGGTLVKFDVAGKLSTGPFRAHLLGPDHSMFASLEAMEAAAIAGKEYEWKGLKQQISLGPRKDTFEIIVHGEDNNPDFKVVVPKTVDPSDILHETDVEKLLSNPTQPPEGVPGKSAGDEYWLKVPFSTLTGISVTPVIQTS